MTRISVDVPDDLYSEFRQKIAWKLGGKKGDLQIALIEAINDWIKKVK